MIAQEIPVIGGKAWRCVRHRNTIVAANTRCGEITRLACSRIQGGQKSVAQRVVWRFAHPDTKHAAVQLCHVAPAARRCCQLREDTNRAPFHLPTCLFVPSEMAYSLSAFVASPACPAQIQNGSQKMVVPFRERYHNQCALRVVPGISTAGIVNAMYPRGKHCTGWWPSTFYFRKGADRSPAGDHFLPFQEGA